MSKLDTILSTTVPSIPQNQVVAVKLKPQIKALMLELIGEDDDLVILAPMPGIQKEAHGKNILRFSLRKKVEAL